jgi:AcrR family transcriptional regulator
LSPAVSAPPRPDRAAAVRAALRRLVAAHGFHGASMSAVAREAGVATGTAYVHYASKEELILAAYLESKLRLGEAAAAAVDGEAPPEARFQALWIGAYRHLAADSEQARFLIQVDGSPYAEAAHAGALERDNDPLVDVAEAPDMASLLLPLPLDVLYELGMAPAVRLAAREADLRPDQLELVATACWRAISRAA